MIKRYSPLLALLFLLLNTGNSLFGQASACPAVTIAPVAPVCSGQCTNLTATVQGTLQTSSYAVSTIPYSPYSYVTGTPVLVNIDDVWTPVINMPFCFQFYGNTYTQLVIGSNGLISFDLTYANAYCQWPINAAIPSASDPLNSIMAPWHDIDPSIGSTSDTRYQVYGTAPCREFVVTWYHVPMFSSSCNSLLATQQIVLHESTNIIDIYIQNKPLCTSWNGGYAIEGIQNAAGTAGLAVAGRNYPTTWTAVNDGKRFMPTGAPNYTLQWTGPSGVIGTGTTVNVCPTATTTYTCTVTNSSCSGPIVVSATQTVTVSSTITTSGSQTNITCFGSCNGTATTNIVTGTGPFTYNWSPAPGGGQGTATATGLCAGTYSCTVSNASTCTVTQTFNITQPPAITLTPSQTNITCFGSCNGSATVTASGGTGTYTYVWAPSGGTAATATGLCPGTYTCTVSSPAGCTATQTFNITQPPAITLTPSQTNVNCFGSCNGSATVTASGGTGTYTYAWAPSGGSAATATGLCAGTYTCTVSSPAGCTATQTFNITQPPAITLTPSQTNITCFGSCTGSATVTASGGTGTYTYAWAPSGGTGSSATGLCAGTYTCTVSSPAGCTATQTFNITQPPAITLTPSQTNITCFGSCTGSATVTASGGNGTYTYAWAPSGGTGSSASGLCAGTYTCTVSSPSGCTATQTFNITQPPAITLTPAQTNITCFGGCNGSATVTATGGTGTYTYAWAPSGGTGSSATGLCVGSYTCTVSSPAGCTATQTFNITQPPVLTATATSTPATCSAINGTVIAGAAGGSPGYSYSWNTAPVQNTATATGLGAGTYTCTVTDANGCTTTVTATVTSTGSVGGSVTAFTNVSCFGGTNGSATALGTGGSGVYNYSWNSSPVQTTATASGLPAGSYTCTITDSNGCSTTVTVTITQPPVLTISGSSTNVLCNGGNTGTASVVVGGGSPGYTYNWNPAPGGGQGTANATGLTAQGYTCTVTDLNGCTITQTFNITQPPALTLTVATTPSTCGNPNGSATVTITGGTGPCNISWTPIGGNAATTIPLLAGTYTVTVTDANGCVATDIANIANLGSPTASITATTNVTCFGACDGTAVLTPSGGNGPFSYNWVPAPGAGQGTASASGMCPGTYTCTVTDVNGCTASDSVTITEPPQLSASGTQTDVSCFAACDGTASVVAVGGTGPYNYNWTPSGGNGASASSLCAGNYTCTITDANGCTTTQTFLVTEPPQLTIAIAGFNVSCYGSCDGQLVVIPGGGTPTYNFAWSSGCIAPSCNSICAGSYTCTITDAHGCTVTDSTIVTEPTPVVASATTVDAHCNQADGSATGSGSGGTGNLYYQWIGGPANANWNNIAPGPYSVIVTDDNGCSDTSSVTVNNIPGVTAALVSVSNTSCNGTCDGAITCSVSGGTGLLTYGWSPSGGNALTANALCSGGYTFTVTDSAGCTDTIQATVTQPTVVSAAASANPTAVCQGQAVQLSATGSGGTPGYTYNWNTIGAGQNQTVSPSSTTTYSVTVTDANGCSDSTTVVVTINPVPVAALSGDILAGCAPLCVNFSDLSTVSSPAVINTWAWDFGDGTDVTQNPSHCYNTPGQYTLILTITTADGCTNTITIPNYINVYANPVAAFSASPQPTTIINPVIQFADSSSGAASWLWSFGDLTNATSTLQNPAFEYPDPTCYNVVLEVTSADGCIDTATQTVCIGPDASIFVPNAFTPNEDGVNEIFLPVGTGLDPDKFEMWIFDRWGNLIYYTDDLNKGWDGKVQGHENICQTDAYVWKIKAIDILGNKHDLIGHVNLIH